MVTKQTMGIKFQIFHFTQYAMLPHSTETILLDDWQNYTLYTGCANKKTVP